jgi:hypothetical protein
MTPEEFITALAGEGWTADQLPDLVVIIGQAQEDAKRYREMRASLASGSETFIARRSDICEIDRLVKAARVNGLL